MTTDNIPPRLANAVLPAVLLESDLKPGNVPTLGEGGDFNHKC